MVDTTVLDQIRDEYGYNAYGELESYAAYDGAPPAPAIYALDFAPDPETRDALGRIVAKNETIGGVTTPYEYTYDVAGRLQTVKENSTTVREYAYDENGNRLRHNATMADAVYDEQDRLLSYGDYTYTYTDDGELETKTDTSNNPADVTTYVYDVFGNLESVTLPDATVISYVVDGKNRRIQKKVGANVVKHWLYHDQLRPIAELDASGNVVARFVYALGRNVPDYMVIPSGQDAGTYRLITDQVGSVRLVVNVATGDIAQRIDYDEFGRVLSDSAEGFQPFGFAGGIYDHQTGLVRFGARDYDADVGRWTSKDPIRFMSGDSPNLYLYVDNNPVHKRDPMGLASTMSPMPPSPFPDDGICEDDTYHKIKCQQKFKECKNSCFHTCSVPKMAECKDCCKTALDVCLDSTIGPIWIVPEGGCTKDC